MFDDSTRHARGSALIIILIAVALFGALSYVVANMMRGGSGNISEEKAKIYAGEIIDYAASIKRAVQNIQISNNCSDTEISFETAGLTGYTNGTNTKCQVFNANGGGLSYVPPSPYYTDATEITFTGENQIDHSAGSSASDLLFILTDIAPEICLQINEKLNITNPSGAPPDDTGVSGLTKFTGVFGSGNTLNDENANLTDALTGCYLDSDSAVAKPYIFYSVLINR